MGIEELLCTIYSTDRVVILREILLSLLLVILGLTSLAFVRILSDPEDFEETVEDVQDSERVVDEGSSVDPGKSEENEFWGEGHLEDTGIYPRVRSNASVASTASQPLESFAQSQGTSEETVGGYHHGSPHSSSVDEDVDGSRLSGALANLASRVSGSRKITADEAASASGAWRTEETSDAHLQRGADEDSES